MTCLVIIANVLSVFAAILIYIFTGEDNFQEEGFITKFSFFQLLAISWLSILIFKNRQSIGRSSIWKSSIVCWAIIAVGFFFLAADELYEIHEWLDELIHQVFGMQETALTDHIDDVLIGIYGIVAIIILSINHNEIRKFPESFPFLFGGFLLLFLMVCLDFITNRIDFISMFFEENLAILIYSWLSILEDSFKVFAEGFFVLAFLRIYQRSKSISNLKLKD